MNKQNLVAKRGDKKWLSPKPYIVSGDIIPLLRRWADLKGFVLPPVDFFNELREEFTRYMMQIFPAFEFIHENELTQGLHQIVIKSGLQPLSLDRVYHPTNPSLDITRFVDTDKNDLGLGSRPNAPSLLQQLRNISTLGKKAVVIDDVIFSGDLLDRVVKIISKMGVRVSLICAGIGISEGIKKLTNAGYQVKCVRVYEDVIDEVCERDFYPGVPLSGRILSGENDVGIPYILPFGDPGKWASIPEEWQESFSRFCLKQTIKLFEAIELYSHRLVLCQDLGRKVIFMPTGNIRYVDELLKLI